MFLEIALKCTTDRGQCKSSSVSFRSILNPDVDLCILVAMTLLRDEKGGKRERHTHKERDRETYREDTFAKQFC